MTMLVELGDYLEDLGIGIQSPDSNANLFLGSRPDAPNTVIVLYQYPGGAPEYVQSAMGPNVERPQLQVVVRAEDYVDADMLINRVWQALAGVTNRSLNGVRYLSIRPNGSPAVMSRDSNERTLMFFNATVVKEVSLVGAS